MSQPQEKSEFAQFLEAAPVTPAEQTKSEFAQFLEQGQPETAQSDMERQREIAAGAVNLYRPANKDMAESRDIYLRQQGKEITGPEAMVVRGGNAATLGALSVLDPNTRDAVRAAGEDQPGWAMAGDIAGFAGTGGTAVANTGMRLIPQTGLGKFVGLGALGGAENAVYEATVGESNRQAAGESKGTAPERLNALVEGGTNPVAWAAGPLFYGAGRATGLIKAPPSENALALASVLDATNGTPVSSDDLRVVERFLRDQGVTLNSEGLAALSGATENALELGAVGPRLPVRFKDLVSEAFPDSADGIVDHLRGTSQLRRGGHSIVDDAVSEDLGQSKEYLTETIQDTLGRQSRLGAEDQSREVLSQIGQEGYEPLLKAGPTNEAGAEALKGILEGPGMSKLYEPLRTIAAGEGKDLDFLLSEKPLAAAHWMQSKARQLSQRGGDEALRGGFGSLRTRLLNGLNAATDGQYDVIRKQYGDEYGNLEALEFGKSFLRDAHKPYELDVMKRSFEGLSEQQQQQALLSVRDTLLSAVGRGQKTNGPRLKQVKEDNVLGALTRVFGDKGDEVRKLIEETRDFVTSRNNASRYGSDTGRNMSAKDIALDNVQPSWRRALGQSVSDLGSDAALSAFFGQVVPFQSIQRQTQRLGKWVGGNPEDKLASIARVLEAPVASPPTNAVAPTPSAPPVAAPVVNALAPHRQPVAQNGIPGIGPIFSMIDDAITHPRTKEILQGVNTNGIGPGAQRRNTQRDIRSGLQDMGATARITPDDRSAAQIGIGDAGAEATAGLPSGAERNSLSSPELTRRGGTGTKTRWIDQTKAQEELSFALGDLEEAGALPKGASKTILAQIGDQAPEILSDTQVERIVQRDGIARMVREQEPWATLPDRFSDNPAGVGPMKYLDDYAPVDWDRSMPIITKTGLLLVAAAGGGYAAYRMNNPDPLLERMPSPPALTDQPSAPSLKPQNALALPN